jgi:hypothetical protein
MFTVIFMLGKKGDESQACLLAVNILITVSDVQEEVLLMMLLKQSATARLQPTSHTAINFSYDVEKCQTEIYVRIILSV